MPHITLQFTSNIESLLNFNKLFSEVYTALNDNDGIKIENCKSKAIELKNFYIGDGTKNKGFFHLEVKILEGRTIEVKSEIGNRLLQILKTHFLKNINLIDLQIAIEIIDIEKNCYFKYPDGTLNY